MIKMIMLLIEQENVLLSFNPLFEKILILWITFPCALQILNIHLPSPPYSGICPVHGLIRKFLPLKIDFFGTRGDFQV